MTAETLPAGPTANTHTGEPDVETETTVTITTIDCQGSGPIALSSLSPGARHILQKNRTSPLPEDTEFSAWPVEYKVNRKKRTVTGVWNAYGHVDLGNDQIMPGAFGESIRESGPDGNRRIKFFWQHEEGIGMPTLLREEATHLYGEARITDHPALDLKLALIEDGVAGDHSIGWTPLDREFIEDDAKTIRRVTRGKLYEGSAVYWPMNELSRITALKAAGDVAGDETNPLADALHWLAAGEVYLADPGLSAREAKACRDILKEIGARSTEALAALGFEVPVARGGNTSPDSKADDDGGETVAEDVLETLLTRMTTWRDEAVVLARTYRRRT